MKRTNQTIDSVPPTTCSRIFAGVGAAAGPGPAAAGFDLHIGAWRCKPALNTIYARLQIGARFVPNPSKPADALLYIPNFKHAGRSANMDADNVYTLVAVRLNDLTLRPVCVSKKTGPPVRALQCATHMHRRLGLSLLPASSGMRPASASSNTQLKMLMSICCCARPPRALPACDAPAAPAG